MADAEILPASDEGCRSQSAGVRVTVVDTCNAQTGVVHFKWRQIACSTRSGPTLLFGNHRIFSEGDDMKSCFAALSLCVAIAVLASSCSYFTMQRPERLEKDMPVCVSNRLAPTIDSVQAAGSGLATIGYTAAAIAGSTRTNFSVGGSVSAAVGSAIATAVWTASAVSGFKRSQACREVKVNYFDERRGSQAAPRPSGAMQNDSRTRRGSAEYMSLKEAAMHCGTSRKSIWNRVDKGSLNTQRTNGGTMLLAEEVKAECGEEPEVPMK